MEPLFRNSILFISGFVVALVLFRHPESIQTLKTYSNFEEQAFNSNESKSNTSSNQRLNVDKLNERPKNIETQRPNLARNFYNSGNSRPSLDAVPNLPEQTPTAPPTGRPQVEGEEENAEEETKVANSSPLPPPTNTKPRYEDKRKESGEASFSSMTPFVGVATMDQSQNNTSNSKSSATSGTPVAGAGGSGGYTSGGSGNGNSEFDLSDDFTTAGLQSAKRLYNNKSISEAEYLEYIASGLESSNTTNKTAAANELVNVKTDNSFALQAQFAYASNANTQILNKAVASAYRTPNDLLFLSQKISDSSSVMTQQWAIDSLEVVIRGSNMDFNNQQVRDTLVNNVYSSLVSLDASHPSYEQARSISNDINEKMS